jgi:hypothetical protein
MGLMCYFADPLMDLRTAVLSLCMWKIIHCLLQACERAGANLICTANRRPIMVAIPRSYTFAVKTAVTVYLTGATSRDLSSWRKKHKITKNKTYYYYDQCGKCGDFFHNYFLLLSTPNNCVKALLRLLSVAPKLCEYVGAEADVPSPGVTLGKLLANSCP